MSDEFEKYKVGDVDEFEKYKKGADVSKTESAIRGFANAATFGLAPRISAAANAGLGKLMPETFGTESYSQRLKDYLAADKAASDANPGTSLVAGAVPNVLQAVATGGGSLARQVGTNAVMGAANRAGNANEGEVLSEAGKGAGIAAALTGAVPLAGKALTKGADMMARSSVAQKVENILATKPTGWEKTLEDILGTTKKALKSEGTTLEKEAQNLIAASRSGELAARDYSNIADAANKVNTQSIGQHIKDVGSTVWEGAKGAGIGAGLAGATNAITGEKSIDPVTAMAGGAGLAGMGAAKKAGESMALNAVNKFATSPMVGKVGETLKNTFSNKAVGAATQLGVKEASSQNPMDKFTEYLRQMPDAEQRKTAMDLQTSAQGRAKSNTESPLNKEAEDEFEQYKTK